MNKKQNEELEKLIAGRNGLYRDEILIDETKLKNLINKLLKEERARERKILTK